VHELVVNGRTYRTEADPAKPLLWVLRDELGLKGTKYGCGVGVCGACVVLLDGAPNHACMVPLARVSARSVTTIEGIGADHPIVRAWIAEQVPQCGYCQPGQILSAAALLAKHPSPSAHEIDEAMSGVLCRCGTYARIRRAVRVAAENKPGAPAITMLPALLDDLPADAGTQLNDWLWIGRDGTVTVMINHSEMGQGALTGLAVLAAEELDVPLSRLRTVFAPADPRYRNGYWGEQFTGGSSSMRGEWTTLREAAATARARLVDAAARRLDVAVGECRTAQGEVLHAASGRRLGYGELAEEAGGLGAPRSAPVKPREAWRYIGKPLARLDIPAMCLGQTRYGIDAAPAGALVAAVARCPVFGGGLRSFDESAARKLPGVREVRAIASGVAVVADDFWSALRGRDALRIAWRPGRNARLSGAQIERRLVAALGRGGRYAIEAVYRTPYLSHAPIEPMNCVARVEGGGCDVWVGTQHQAETQGVAARVAGVPKSRVRVHTEFLGGGFGRRLETDFVAEAVELAKALGRPVQVVWTRADDLQHDFYRPAHAARLQASLGTDGLPAEWRIRVAGPELALDGVHSPYAVPLGEARVEVRSPLPTGAWRSVGASNNAFAIECFVDELAARAGRDPLEYRLALLAKAPRHRAVLEQAARGADWVTPFDAGRGRGIALYESFGSIAALVIEARVEARAIRVERAVCAIDCGTAVLPDAVHAQLEGSVAFGLSAALKEEIRVGAGRVRQASFTGYPILTLAEMPAVETHIVQSDAEPGGVGEPAVPVVAPALANAVFAASGRRLRRLPLRLR
jgi:isoquinoline 1-oxidoreductase beta subunit